MFKNLFYNYYSKSSLINRYFSQELIDCRHPRGLCGRESPCQFRGYRGHGFNPWVRKILWKRNWQPTPALLPGKFQGQRSMAVYSTCGHKDSDTTEQLSTQILYHIFLTRLFVQQKVLEMMVGSRQWVGRVLLQKEGQYFMLQEQDRSQELVIL